MEYNIPLLNSNIYKYYRLMKSMIKEDYVQNPGRRLFLKKAGLASLAIAGAGILGGCAMLPNADMDIQFAGRDFKKYDFNEVAKRYEGNPIPINSIEDFALSGEELGWMRLSEGGEKILIPYFESNPHQEKSNKYSFVVGKGSPVVEECLFAEYMGRIHYPKYGMFILSNKFQSEKDCLEAEKILKERRKLSYLSSHKSRTFSRANFMAEISTGNFLNETQKQDYLSRVNLYQNKRGLDVIWSNF